MNREISDKLRAQIPGELIKQRSGFDYISGQTAIDRLIQATDNEWSFRITNVISGSGHVAMQGELTIAGTTRSAWGEAATTGRTGEELYKTCETDTLKRCARLFGVALELYGDLLDEETGEVTHRATPQPRQNAPQARQSNDTRRQDAAPMLASQDATQGRILPSADNLITPRQVKFLKWKASENGYTPEELDAYLREAFGVTSCEDLTKPQASKAIDHVQGINEPAPVNT